MGDRQFRTYDTSALQPKRSKGPMIAFIAVIVVVALLLILGVSTLVRGCTSGNLVADGQQVTVEVADGASTSSIAQSLQEAGLVSSASDFTKKVSDLGLDGSLQPGTYTLTGGMSLEDLAKMFSAGPGLTGPSVTIPEGLTLANIADRVSSATNGRISADDFKAQATNTTDYNFTVTAARGDIVDSSGRRIATSTTSYNVVLNKLLMGDRDLDTMLQQVVELLRENGESWNDTLLIGQPDAAGHYEFTDDDTSTSDQKQLADMKDTLGLQQYATADDVMEMLVEKNNLQDFSLEWQRVLAGIHYEMDRQAFSNVNNFVMAENVSAAAVATIKEHSLQLPGVEIVETSARSYEQSDIIPAVLGRVGKITAEKWKVTDSDGNVTYPLREKGYNMNDILGISGLESAYEDELRGKDGVETITRNSDGVIVDTQLTTVPEPGHTVQLTIDSNFQRAVDKALAENIDMINRVYNTGDMKAAAAAAVVIDVKDGGVLAASNYPSFDQNLYATNYSEYSSDPGLPLFNRALQGLYTPGSTFKPAVAVAALDSGLINQYSTVNCTGAYTYYKDYHPRCTRHGHSGNIDVVTAIKWSCNIFFYDVGRRLTSDVYDAYAYKLGLGQRTGVEVNEAVGRLTKKTDKNYVSSLDIQAAIGQGNTVVSPIQLATYAATLANNGVRYRTHFVKAILDTNTGEVLSETQPEVMDIIEGNGNTFDLVRQGMTLVPSTISGKISSYPIAIA